jgi:5-formyltetrahydrofolate cyclo-ligase
MSHIRTMKKSELRALFRQKRKALTPVDVARMSEEICSTIVKHFLPEGASVHLFLPIEKNNEPDLRPLLQTIFEERTDIRVATSVTRPELRTLDHFLITPETTWTENAMGIPEPVDADLVNPSTIDIVFVPLLACDKSGARVGYGQGYYDRFLEAVPEALRVGISFFEPIDTIEDTGVHDMALHACILPDAVCFFDTE